MAEPVALDTWLGQEEGFAWILIAQRSADPAQRARAARARLALAASLERIVGRGEDRGWIRHRQVRYFVLVERAAEGWRVMTLARSMSWLDEPPEPPAAQRPAPPAPPPFPVAREHQNPYAR